MKKNANLAISPVQFLKGQNIDDINIFNKIY